MNNSSHEHDRFGLPSGAFEAAINSHGNSPAIRSGMYVPTRTEVAILSLEELQIYLNEWMWESPTELIPSRDQISQVKDILESRGDKQLFLQLIENCREYIEDN